MSKVRDSKFDILRAIGLLAIILAHVSPPDWINQLRNFDVPLMVFVSAAVFPTKVNYLPTYFSYLKKRIVRLLLPTWVFLTFFFLFFLLLSILKLHPFPYSRYVIYNTFLLNKGIGFVWIIRVFILMAMLMPFLTYLFIKIKNKNLFLISNIVIFLLYDVIYIIFTRFHVIDKLPVIDFLFQNFIYYALSYGFVASMGIYIKGLGKKSLIFVITSFFVLTLTLLYLNKFGSIEEAKYPPTLYYLSYALLVSISLYFLLTFEKIKSFLDSKLLLFIGRYSLWIYLWHILYIFLWKYFHTILNKSFDNYFIEYIFVLFCGFLTTYFQITFLKRLVENMKRTKAKYLLEISFLT